MNIKYILSSTIFVTVVLLCAAFFIMQDHNKDPGKVNGLYFTGFSNSTMITARYISENHSSEKTFSISDKTQTDIPDDTKTAVIQIIIKDNAIEKLATLSRKNGTIKTHIEGLNSRELVSFTANNLTQKIPADWAGQLQTDINSTQDFCISVNAGKICHYSNKEISKS